MKESRLLNFTKKDLRKVAVNIVQQIADLIYRVLAIKERKNIKNDIRARIKTSSKWRPGPKVYGVGLSKTGTTSLSRALEILGYKESMHWIENRMVIDWTEFFYADAATDISCSFQFESLYHTFEESKFIYTVRDVKSWKQSIKNHFRSKYHEEFDCPNELRRIHTRDSFWGHRENEGGFHNSIQRIKVHESLYAQHSSWEKAYRSFDSRIHQFFKDKPDDRLLKINIIDGEGWELLCPFLECDIPNRPFPHANESGRNTQLDPC